MSDNKSFTSGETYNLSELFSGKHKIIIPDLQRDYCWGNDSHTEEKKDLVTGFVNNIISQFQVSSNTAQGNLNLGLIYGYESPKDYIQLCDGQQRITTLFLLIGSLNKKVQDNPFSQYLISDFEYNQDDKEPYLQYSIRESSLYFISDLVCHYFINKKEEDSEYAETVDEIKKSSWFFNEYNTDPSIQSMLKAISKIEKILTGQTEEWCKEFGKYLVEDLTFMYYDMVDRKNGEETFVVINTTGEPLSPTQNLKPLIIAANSSHNDIPSRWEEIETWFWKNRQGENDTADAGFNEFLRWVTILNTDKVKEILAKGRYSFPKDSITFEVIYEIYKKTKFLFEEWDTQADKLQKSFLSPEPNNETNGLKCISQINCFVLLPLIAYCTKWGIQDTQDQGLCRLYHFLQNLTRLANVSKAVNELVGDAIYIAKNYRDIVDVLNDNKISTTILTEEEKGKLHIIKTADNKRPDVEKAFWEAQEHEIWNGQIWPLIEWAGGKDSFSLDDFNKYKEIFNTVFKDGQNDTFDFVRRALLTRNLKGYPRVFKGYTNLSFGWEWSDWKVLINDNKDEFKSFFDRFANIQCPDWKTICEDMINEYLQNKPTNKTEYTDFIEYPYLMSYCEVKNIQSNLEQGILLLKKKRTSAAHISVACKHLYEKMKDNKDVTNNWNISDEDYGGVVLKHKKNGITIYIYNHIQNHDESNESCSNWTIHVYCNESCIHKETVGSDTSTYTEVLDFIKNFQLP